MAGVTGERGWRERNARGLDTLAAVVVITLLIVLLSLVFLEGRSLDVAYMAEVLPIFGPAALLSLFATVTSFAVGMIIGFLVGWARVLPSPLKAERPGGASASLTGREWAKAGVWRFFRRAADFYVETMRGTPLLVQIFFVFSIFLVLAPRGLGLPTISLLSGIVAMTINTGGYQGEIFRGGIQAVPPGQLEAARGIGLTERRTMRHVVLPQAIRLVIPPLTNEFIALFKASSLLFIIGVTELTFVGRRLAFFNPQIFEVFVLLTAVYLSITIPLSFLTRYLERRFAIAGLGIARPEVGRK